MVKEEVVVTVVVKVKVGKVVVEVVEVEVMAEVVVVVLSQQLRERKPDSLLSRVARS